MSVFVPRLKAPSTTDKNWIDTAHGGKNMCMTIRYDTGSVLPNCTGYAWGRFMEILGSTPRLSRGNAGRWYLYTSDGYQRGSKPRLGAVACWSHYISGVEQAGHVAVVEKIDSDGTITLSHSGWKENAMYSPTNSGHWWLSTGRAPNYLNWSGYTFQGFIYCPSISSDTDTEIQDPLSRFLANASNRVGLQWKNDSSSDFVYQMFKSAASPSPLISESYSVFEFAKKCYSSSYGKWNRGPYLSSQYTPKSGDVVFFRYTRNKAFSDVAYRAESCGVVWSCKKDSVYVIEVYKNTQEVILSKYGVSSNTILGYYHPNWESINCDPDSFWASQDDTKTIFDETFDKEDAALRRVIYINRNSEPSIYLRSSEDSPTSVINYTSGLASVIGAVNSLNRGSNISVDSSKLNNNARIIFDILLKNDYTIAAAVGILANIKSESNFRPSAVGDNGTSFGICQWHLGRGTNMKAFCGSNWANNLSGQVEYLMHELQTSYVYSTRTLEPMLKQPNTEDGCRACADIFVRTFEIPGNIEAQSLRRQSNASEIWNTLIMQYSSSSNERYSV